MKSAVLFRADMYRQVECIRVAAICQRFVNSWHSLKTMVLRCLSVAHGPLRLPLVSVEAYQGILRLSKAY